MRRRILVTLLMAAVMLVPAPSSDATAHRLPSGQWSMFMNGPLRRGVTPIVGAQTSNLAWRISTETNYGGPVVGRDGTIYQGTFDRGLLAIRPNGTIKWSFPTASILESTPAILVAGRIAFVDDGGNLYVVNPDGSPSWGYRSVTSWCCNSTAPAIGRDGTIYTGIDETGLRVPPRRIHQVVLRGGAPNHWAGDASRDGLHPGATPHRRRCWGSAAVGLDSNTRGGGRRFCSRARWDDLRQLLRT